MKQKEVSRFFLGSDGVIQLKYLGVTPIVIKPKAATLSEALRPILSLKTKKRVGSYSPATLS